MATNIRFQGLVKTTAEIEADKFAGRIGWNTTLARFVAYYNSTQYAQMARRDVLETFSQGIQDSTLTAGLPMVASTGGRHVTQDVATFRGMIGVEPGTTMFRDVAKSFSTVQYTGGWRSLLSASSAKRKIPANTIKAGTAIEFEYHGKVSATAYSGINLELTFGPSDFGTGDSEVAVNGYYLNLIPPYTVNMPDGTYFIRAKVVIACATAGANADMRVSWKISMKSSVSGHSYEYESVESGNSFIGEGTDTTVDNYVGLYLIGTSYPTTFYGAFSTLRILPPV